MSFETQQQTTPQVNWNGPVAGTTAPADYQPAPRPHGPVTGTDRSPAVVAVLSVVTLGLYLIYWWYVANREMRDFARTVQPTHPLAGSSPGTSVFAVTLGALVVVPLWVTAHSTARRVGETGALAGLPPHDRPSAPLFMLMFTIGGLLIVPPFFYAPLLQSRLNRAWAQARAAAQQPPAQPHDWLTAGQAG